MTNEAPRPNPNTAALQAEDAIQQYTKACGATTAEDAARVLEMLISKAARAIEKYNGTPAAIRVLVTTTVYIERNPANYVKH